MFTGASLFLVAIATVTESRVLPWYELVLVDQMQAIANSIRSSPKASQDNAYGNEFNTDQQTVLPGRSNICDSLCPKWCQKINETATSSTNCHYLCGNICYDKKTSMNPFIGNERYQVVPSEYEFSKYDTNGDKLITVDEFARTEGVSKQEVADMFIFTDLNGDGFIDTQEFQGGPLVFTVQMAAELSAMAMQGQTTTPTPRRV